MHASRQRTSLPLRRIMLVALACLVVVCASLRHFLFSSAPAALQVTTPTRSAAASRLSERPNIPPPTLAPRWEDAAPGQAPPRPGKNASSAYQKAFALFDQLSDDEKKMLRKPEEEVDADAAAALYAKVKSIMDLLREAAAAGYCDWGIGPIRFDTPMPQITKGGDLGKLALWAAAYQFPNDPAAALDALEVRAKLGTNLGDTLIGLLVESGFEAGAIKLIRENAGLLDATTMGRALWLIGGSTLDGDLSRAFESEIASLDSLGEMFSSGSPEVRAQLQGVLGKDADAAQTEVVLRDPARLASELAFIRDLDGKMAAAMRLPEAEFQSWWEATHAQLQSGHPLAKQFLPSMESIQQRVQKMRVERTLLNAGLDVLANGPARLPRYVDPATGNALLYAPAPGGFELRSTYQVKGKPVSLSFSQKK